MVDTAPTHLHVLDWGPAGAVCVGMGEEKLRVVSRHEQPEPAGVVVEYWGALTDRHLVSRVGLTMQELKRLPRLACSPATVLQSVGSGICSSYTDNSSVAAH